MSARRSLGIVKKFNWEFFTVVALDGSRPIWCYWIPVRRFWLSRSHCAETPKTPAFVAPMAVEGMRGTREIAGEMRLVHRIGSHDVQR